MQIELPVRVLRRKEIHVTSSLLQPCIWEPLGVRSYLPRAFIVNSYLRRLDFGPVFIKGSMMSFNERIPSNSNSLQMDKMREHSWDIEGTYLPYYFNILMQSDFEVHKLAIALMWKCLTESILIQQVNKRGIFYDWPWFMIY